MNEIKIRALNEAAKNKRDKTFIKVKAVLKVMHEKSLPINFSSVAKLCNVSKTWLYKEDLIAAEIKRARNKDGTINRVIDYQAALTKKENDFNHLKDRNKLLQEQVKQLQTQLEIVHGELYKMKNQIKFTVIK